MKRGTIGELEELILLIAINLGPNAYGNAIKTELENSAERTIRLSAIHATLYRLEEKEMLCSSFGQTTATRGGKRKRIFSVTTFGYKTLQEVHAIRTKLWNGIDQTKLQFV